MEGKTNDQKCGGRLGISICGVDIDVDLNDPGMPEDVREYYREVTSQLEEIGEEGRYEITNKIVPEYVNRYVSGVIKEIAHTYDKLTDDVLVGEIADERFFDYLRLRAAHIAQKIIARTPKENQDGIAVMADVFADAFVYLRSGDKDWRKLGAKTAIDLYLGVVIAVCGLLAAETHNSLEEETGEEAEDNEENR